MKLRLYLTKSLQDGPRSELIANTSLSEDLQNRSTQVTKLVLQLKPQSHQPTLTAIKNLSLLSSSLPANLLLD